MQSKIKIPWLALVFAGGILLGRLQYGAVQPNSSQPSPRSAFLVPSDPTEPDANNRTGSEDISSIQKERLDSPEEIKTRFLEILRKAEAAGSLADARICTWEAICGMNTKTLEALWAYPGPPCVGWGVLKCLGKRLGEIAPEKAAAAWLNNTHSECDTGFLLSPWIAKDPVGFAAWLGAQSAEVRKDLARPLSSMSLKRDDLAAILKQTPDLIPDEVRAEVAYKSMASALKSARQDTLGQNPEPTTENRAEYAEKMLALARGLPDGPARIEAFVNLARDENLDFSRHPEIVTALATLPDDELPVRALARYADQLPEGSLRETAMLSKFESDAKSDAEAAATRLNSLVNTKDYAYAVQGFVNATAKKDPSAALAWALSISGGEQRASALETAARAYYLQNPEEARAWLNQAPLTEAEYFQLTGRHR